MPFRQIPNGEYYYCSGHGIKNNHQMIFIVRAQDRMGKSGQVCGYYIPKECIGKKVKIKIEFVEDDAFENEKILQEVPSSQISERERLRKEWLQKMSPKTAYFFKNDDKTDDAQ